MVSFIAYDIVFLVLFSLFVIIFLYTRKQNLERQGILYIYRTKLGIRFIDKFATKFEKILRPMEYVVLVSGFVLMGAIVWLIVWTTYLYLKFPIAEAISAPPVFPLIPYFPKLFGLESFFPPLYFAYFIVALGIVAIVHEFSHGIFMRLYNFKIKSTGFAFLGPFLGAFVEQDEKEFVRMERTRKKPIMVILAAGTFANVVATVVFGLLMALFFTSFFTPAGVKFNSYALSGINIADISSVENSSIPGFVKITVDGEIIGDPLLESPPDEIQSRKFFINEATLERAREVGAESVFVVDDSPAFNAQIEGAITEINGEKVTGYDKFVEILGSYNPGDEVNIRTAVLEPGRGTIAEVKEYNVELADRNGKAFLGVGFFPQGRGGVIGFTIENTYNKIKDPLTHYESEIGDFGWFIFYLLWWIVVINILVALFNMLPLGILDGGRFFYLTIWGLTGSEKIGRKSYSFVTWFLILLFILMTIRWVFRFF